MMVQGGWWEDFVQWFKNEHDITLYPNKEWLEYILKEYLNQ